MPHGCFLRGSVLNWCLLAGCVGGAEGTEVLYQATSPVSRAGSGSVPHLVLPTKCLAFCHFPRSCPLGPWPAQPMRSKCSPPQEAGEVEGAPAGCLKARCCCATSGRSPPPLGLDDERVGPPG